MQQLSESILARALPNGSFSLDAATVPSVDSTAWAAIALRKNTAAVESLAAARAWLAGIQRDDGRLTAAPDQLAAWWPTPLAVLAWQGAREFVPAESKALGFLAASGGLIFQNVSSSPTDVNTELRGWSWINGTISWIEPTAQSILAFQMAGHGDHPRVAEGVKMIMSRQLPSGGWNYGNSKVYGAELRPMPANTGLALAALEGHVAAAEIAPSLDYMARVAPTLHSPLSAAWSILGLRGWQRAPEEAQGILEKSAALQERAGTFETPLLAQLLLAFLAPAGFGSHFKP